MLSTPDAVSTRAHRAAAWCLISILGPVCACLNDQPGADILVRDSAGVTVVENFAPEWADQQGWQVAVEPLLHIGEADGPVEYQFHRIEGVLRLPNDGIVVADGGSGELRFFEQNGRFRRSVGGHGDAPGEYRQFGSIGYGPGDSLWVYDFGSRRFTVLTSEMQLSRTVSVGGTLSAVGAVGRLSDGSFVIREYWSAGVHDELRTGLARDPSVVALLSTDGATLDTLGVFPGREIFVGSEGGRAVMSAPLFARNTSAALREDEILIGDQALFEIGFYASDGSLKQSIRIPDVDLRLRAANVAQLKQELLDSEPAEQRAMFRAHLDAMEVPATRPAYSTLLVDPHGNVWVGEYVRFPQFPRTWTVFGPGGVLLGDVVMPDRFSAHQIGPDWVAGVWRDEDDVEFVRLYELRK